MLGGAETLAEGPVVQMGEEEEKTGVVLRAKESTVVVLWAGAADNRYTTELRVKLVSIATGAHAHNLNYVHLRACV